MPTDCSADRLEFARIESCAVVASLDGGTITSDAGALLLGATDRAIGLVRRFVACFTDHRAPDRIEHGVATLVGQRVFALALGYEDLVDHDQLRHDPVLAAVAGRLAARRSNCAPLAGKSTLNRLEHAPVGGSTRYHKIVHDGAAIELAAAKAEAKRTGKAARCFRDFRYQTLDTWSRERRVVGKAEQLLGGNAEPSSNPRFVVTSLPTAVWPAALLYERLYCARGEMENRIKECQLDQPCRRRGSIPARVDVRGHRRGADRTSARAMRANQLRLVDPPRGSTASMAYVLLAALRRIALPATSLARATVGTIRLRLLKIGALVRVSVRRVTIAMTSGHPWRRDWAIAHQALTTAAA